MIVKKIQISNFRNFKSKIFPRRPRNIYLPRLSEREVTSNKR